MKMQPVKSQETLEILLRPRLSRTPLIFWCTSGKSLVKIINCFEEEPVLICVIIGINRRQPYSYDLLRRKITLTEGVLLVTLFKGVMILYGEADKKAK